MSHSCCLRLQRLAFCRDANRLDLASSPRKIEIATGAGYDPDRFSREFLRKQNTHDRLHPETALPRLNVHGLRHSHATHGLKRGVHPKIMQERLGHSSFNTTMNMYSHLPAGMQAEMAEQLASDIYGG